MPRLFAIAAALLAIAPEAHAEVATPTAWTRADVARTDPHMGPPDAYWRAVVADPVLRDLLDSVSGVEDVAIAAARLEEAEGFRRAARGSLFPALSIFADVGASAAEGTSGVGSARGGVTASAPLDLNGAVRARSRAAAERRSASQADLAQARLDARRSIGQLYASLRAAQSSRAAAERQTGDADDSLALARARAESGLDSGLAIAQAQSAADAARARIPAFAQAEMQARLGLEALLGLAPGALSQRLAPAPTASFDARALIDAPIAVMERRPDVRAAAARLSAAGLDARAARGDRWPTASIALSATQTSLTRGPAGGAATATAGLLGTVFDFGRLDALADAANARARGEAALYRRTLTFAISEVEREADRAARALEERDAARAALSSATEQAQLARTRYRAGLTSFLDVLIADRARADADIAAAAADGRALDAAVTLAAALGLGQSQ
jgi:outer membrane protein TolC